MAGRGRGRGTGLSFTPDQLQLLGGITRQDNTYSTPTAPPPLFPKLMTKPLPLNCDAATDYMLIVKDQFIEYLHDSPAYVKPRTRTDGVERYSDKYKVLAQDAKKRKILDCNWTHMPTELKPQVGRIRAVARKRKLEDPADIDKRLQTLEKKETLEGEDNMETNEEESDPKKGDNDEEDLDDEHEQEDEVDDGTDYANNYFDNGEDYDEEDDNLDDVPVF